MRVKKYDFIFCVKLSAIILFLFTLNPGKVFSLPTEEISGGSGGYLPPYVSDLEDFFPGLEVDLSEYKVPVLKEQLDSLIENIGNSPSGTPEEITYLTTSLNEYYAQLNSTLEKIDFYLDTMILPDIKRCEFIKARLPREDWGGVDYNKILSELKQRRADLIQAKQWIESQMSEIDSIYSGLLNLGLAEFDFDMGAFSKFQEFKQNFLNMTEDEIQEKIADFKQELIEIQSERKKIHQQLNNARRGMSFWKDENSPLGRITYRLYNSIARFLTDVDKEYEEMAEILDKYVTQENLLLAIHRDFNNLVSLVGQYDFLFQEGALAGICYLDKLLRSIKLEDRQQITAQISRDLDTITSTYNNLLQYSDLLGNNPTWWDIQRKMNPFGEQNLHELYSVVKGVNGPLLIDDWYEGKLDLRLIQLSIALELQLNQFRQNPSQLLSQRVDFPSEIYKLEDMLFNLNEAQEGLSFLRKNGILPQYVRTFETSLSALRENNPSLSGDEIQKYCETVSAVYQAILTAQKYEQQRAELEQELHNFTGEGEISSQGEQVLHQIEMLKAKRDEALNQAYSYLSQVRINSESGRPWVSIGDSPSGEPVTALGEHQQVSSSTAVVPTQSIPKNDPSGKTDEPDKEPGQGMVHAQSVPDSSPSSPSGEDSGGAPPPTPLKQNGNGDGSGTAQAGDNPESPGSVSPSFEQRTKGPNLELERAKSLNFAEEGLDDKDGRQQLSGVALPTVSTGSGDGQATTVDTPFTDRAIPEVSDSTINDYIVKIANRIFNRNEFSANYSEINEKMAQLVFTISDHRESKSEGERGYSTVDNKTYPQMEERLFRPLEKKINNRILKSLTQEEGKPHPNEDKSFQNIGEVKILGVIGLGNGRSYMIIRAKSNIREEEAPQNNEGEGKTSDGEQSKGEGIFASGENLNPDRGYIVNLQRAIEMVQSGENTEKITKETGLSKEMVNALQQAWRNGTIVRNSSGAYIVVQVEVNGEKKIVIIPADTIVYVTSSKPSEIVKEIIKKVFLKKPQASDATVNKIFILFILLAVLCMAGGIALAVVITRREYRKWLEYQPPVPQKPAGKTKPVYTKFVTSYHTYYRK